MKFTIITSILIIIAVLIPGKQIPDPGIVGLDKFVHFGMFFTWAVSFRYETQTRLSPLMTLLVGLLFSLFTEVIQIAVEGRTFDWLDLATDFLGLCGGLLASGLIIRTIQRYFKN